MLYSLNEDITYLGTERREIINPLAAAGKLIAAPLIFL